MKTSASYLLVETSPNPEFCIIWLHGLGADGYDFLPVVKELDTMGLPPTRFIFPHAPMRPVSINAGHVMRAWYDIKHVNLQRQEDEGGIRESANVVSALINEQINAGLKPKHLILAGFSQGAAIAYQAGLRFEQTLGGLVALSGYLPVPDTLEAEKSQANIQTPIFVAHGSQDPVVPLDRGESAAKQLEQSGYAVQWQSYPMEHSLCMEEIQDIHSFIKAVFV
ncbi:MAG: alpha/beta hydrolase [Limnobacter sp.]|nr:alpha/beta hydrolase [Limnobacter sp.]